MRKLFQIIALTAVSLALVTYLVLAVSPMLPSSALQKQAMSVFYSDKSYADNIAYHIALTLQSPTSYGFKDEDEVVHWMQNKTWLTADGGSRQIYIQPQVIDGFGWPTVVNAVTVSVVNKHDGSRTSYRYYI